MKLAIKSNEDLTKTLHIFVSRLDTAVLFIKSFIMNVLQTIHEGETHIVPKKEKIISLLQNTERETLFSWQRNSQKVCPL